MRIKMIEKQITTRRFIQFTGSGIIIHSVMDPDPQGSHTVLFAGSGSVTRGYGSGSGFGSETGLKS
jgi:hypothetical protein